MDGTSTAWGRTAAAWGVLRSGEPDLARDGRWPWLLTAAVAGAVAGAAVAWAVRQVHTADAPEAQEPEQLRAVVDRPAT